MITVACVRLAVSDLSGCCGFLLGLVLYYFLALSALPSLPVIFFFSPFRLSVWLQLKLCRDIKSYNLKEVGGLL